MKISLPSSDAPVRPGKLLCIGRNYAKHAAEMDSDVPTTPMVFLKPSTALVRSGGAVTIPRASSNVHHELELVVAIGRRGKDIPAADALDYVAGYALGLDMTARDIQSAAKERRHPWSVAKGFDTFAPLGPFVPARSVENPQALTFQLAVNGTVRQQADTRHMIFSVADLIAYCSTVFTLEAGDLLYTGTPEGVAQVQAGDVLEATGDGLEPLRVTVGAAR
ncbi:fumarylacetoacetate hydrolase family protein [Salisaeta longa]|uniref:fumarylacetoacetate hydrolase family protein n=1 Tax=Salisaeta longa TaxID=503170 RepID=UPI0003B795D4|nr:fumarylacetoacetate hydrolase family protein [Salisaeta longa]